MYVWNKCDKKATHVSIGFHKSWFKRINNQNTFATDENSQIYSFRLIDSHSLCIAISNDLLYIAQFMYCEFIGKVISQFEQNGLTHPISPFLPLLIPF